MQSQQIREQIVSVCRRLTIHRLNQGSAGNLSVRFGDHFLITPSGLGYESMSPDDVVALDYQGRRISGRWEPSSEWRFHADILAARPEIGAVLHVHAPYSTGLACTRQGIPAFHYMVAVAGGSDIRCARYATFGTQALSDAALEALQERRACLLANHGMIAIATDAELALSLAIEVETLAAQYVHARACGDPVLLSSAQMQEVTEKFENYGQIQHECRE